MKPQGALAKEIRAVMRSDLLTSKARSAREARDAAYQSLLSLLNEQHAIAVIPHPEDTARGTVHIQGPTLCAQVPIVYVTDRTVDEH